MQYNLETVEGRKKYLVDLRRENIKKFKQILNGECSEYKKYMNDQTFLNSVRKHLKIEKDLLNDLLKDDLEEMNIGDELVVLTDTIVEDLIYLGFSEEEVDFAVTDNRRSGRNGVLTLTNKTFNMCHGNTEKYTLVRIK